MPSPPLRTDFINSSSPASNQLSATEYNLNATRTDEALDTATSAAGNATAALALPRTSLRSLFDMGNNSVASVGAGFDCTAYTVDTTISAYTGQVSYPWDTAASRFRYGATMVDIGDGQTAGWPSINTATGAAQVGSCEIEVYVYGTDVTFRFYSYGDNDYKIMVDGRHLKQHTFETFPAGANTRYIHLTFGTVRVRRIRIFIGNVGFKGAYTPATGAIWPAEPRPKWLMTGDSFGQGSGGTSEGTLVTGTLCGWFAVKAGVEVWNYCQGGTGYQNPGGGSGRGKYGSTTRRAAYAAMTNVAGMIVIGSANDANLVTYPVATTRTEAASLWSALKAAHTSAPLVVYGVESGPYPASNSDLNTLNAGLKAEALAHADVDRYVDSRTVPWVSGTGNIAAQVGDGNADIFTASDTVHPTQKGWERALDRMLDDLRGVMI